MYKLNLSQKKVFNNFIFLSINQIIELLVPLISFKYLISSIGVEKFGLLNFILAFIMYFQIITDYGFNNSATRQISLANSNQKKINIIINNVVSSKIYLLALSFIIFIVIISLVPNLREYWDICILYFGLVVGYAFIPIWYFQGIQETKSFTIINSCLKILSLIAIIVLIKEQKHYWIAPIIFSLSYIIVAIISLYQIFKKNSFYFKFQKPKKVLKELKSGKYLFLSELQASLFTNTNILILGFFTSLSNVAYFTTADKLSRSVRNLQVPFSNALYPYISKKIHDNPKETLKLINKITLIGLIILIIIYIILISVSKEIIILLFGNDMLPANSIFQILLLVPIFTFIDTMYGKQILLTLKKDSLFFKIFLFSAIFCLIISLTLTFFYNLEGTAIAVVIGQGLLALNMFYFAQKVIYGKD